MPDSEESKKEQSLVLLNPDGTSREQLRGAGGRFVKKPRRMVTTREITRMGRKIMNMPVPEGEKLGKRFINRFEKLFLTLYEIATNPLALEDSKYAQASVGAAKELMLRVGGRPTVSDEEMESLKNSSGVKVIIIPTPELMNPRLLEEREKEKLQPSFIDVEIVHTDEPKQ